MLNTFGNYSVPNTKTSSRQEKIALKKQPSKTPQPGGAEIYVNDIRPLPKISQMTQSRMMPMMPPMNPANQQNFRKLQYDQEHQLMNMLQQHYEDQMNLLASLMNPPQSQPQSQKPSTIHSDQSNNKFKPYTLAQYRKLKEMPVVHNGRLGPQIPVEEWSILKEKRDKMFEYAENVQNNNEVKLRHKTNHIQSQIALKLLEKDKGARQKGNIYASHITLPKIKKQVDESDYSQSEFQTQPPQDLLSQYERRNQYDRQAVANTK